MRIDLLPADLRPPKTTGIRWIFLVSVLAFVFLVVVGGFAFLQHLQLTTLRQQHQNAVEYTMQLQRQRAEVDALQAELRELESRYDEYEQIVERAQAGFHPEHILTVQESASARVWWETMDFVNSEAAITGYTFELSALSDMLRNLGFRAAEPTVRRMDSHDQSRLIQFIVETEEVLR